MTYEKKFIEEPLLQYEIMRFLEKQLDRNDLANIDIQRTPVITRITLEVMNASKLTRRRSNIISRLTKALQDEFNIKDPQISVVEVKNPALEPKIVGRRAMKMMEMGKKARAVLHFLLSETLSNGAIGAEIVISGAMSRGSRAKRMRMVAGLIPKSGESTRLVREARVISVSKYGTIGIFVRIVPPGTVLPDRINPHIELPKAIKSTHPLTEDKAFLVKQD
ncbi:MAG: 30S ribosomal protein S3 [Candidatus Micrarchaeota archaeon]